MSKIFYIADMHIGHENVIRFDNRHCKTVEEMDEQLINNWNAVVTNKDTVYVLGDFCWGKADMWIDVSSKLNGNKILITGNHDLQSLSKELRKHGKWIDVAPYKEIKDGDNHVVLCHYPIMCYNKAYKDDTYMLHGHVHITRENYFTTKWTRELRETCNEDGDSYGQIINVGCMMPWMDYTPRTLDEILECYYASH